jgi:hypothetical protein
VRTLDGRVVFGIKPEELIREIKENIANRELRFEVQKLK